jgi:hypothetical protein
MLKSLTKLGAGICVAAAFLPAYAERLKPQSIMCNTEAYYDAYCAAETINDTVTMSQLMDTGCHSTTAYTHAQVTVLRPGVTMSFVRLTFPATGDTANVYLSRNAVLK